MSAEIFRQARDLIQQERYADARQLLDEVDHPKAREWLQRIDELDPAAQPKMQVIQPQFPVQPRSNTFTIPGLYLDITGLDYDMKPPWWASLFARRLQWHGFIPLRDITAVEYIRMRVLKLWQAIALFCFIQAIFLTVDLVMPRLSGSYGIGAGEELLYVGLTFLFVLLLWLFGLRNGILVYSHGSQHLVLGLPRSEAESFLRLYHFLRAKAP